jgi:hypothetical protein
MVSIACPPDRDRNFPADGRVFVARWALFILIPALGSFATAYGAYRTNGGRLNSMVRGSISGGLVFTAVAAAFLFELNLGLLLPAVLILAGAGVLINSVPGFCDTNGIGH